ncbi:uncharacterized protein [Chelonus insularis]|uniref:uncharacterized protein n=1 Tax=Chelonus insularis TaxID=460826 RepID=UPI001588F848|nr:uncharacterized protein LOC118066332 [Chelonus insularis]XP_034938175.1 uncharacterized protein LOC118066332 [Chelonus insularis]
MNTYVEYITVNGSNEIRSTLKNIQTLRNQKNLENKDVTKNKEEKEEIKFIELTEIFAGDLPPDFENLTDVEKHQVVKKLVTRNFPNQPESLSEITAGTFFPGEHTRNPDIKPSWYDEEKFLRGQKFAQDNYVGLFLSELLSLFLLFSFEDGLKPIIFTQNTSEPYTSFKRYLSLSSRVRNWYTTCPFTKGTPAYKDIQVVKRMHGLARKKFDSSTNEEIDRVTSLKDTWAPTRDLLVEDFRETCEAPLPGQCPYAMNEVKGKRPKGLSQGEMASTQCAFVCLMILYPEKFGVHDKCEEDLEAFCHLWRGLGFLLGIEDEFNFCRGTLEDVKLRSRNFIDYWGRPNFRVSTREWEHMLRCAHEGKHWYYPRISYEMDLLYLTEMLELNMPRLKALITPSDWITYNMTKFIIKYPFRVPQIKSFFNKHLNQSIDRALKYDQKEHEKLREKSAKIIKEASATGVDKIRHSSLSDNIVAQLKFVKIFMSFLVFSVLWRAISFLI